MKTNQLEIYLNFINDFNFKQIQIENINIHILNSSIDILI